VHIYKHERVLVACLLEYVSAGLARSQTCVVVASPQVLIGLQKGLRRFGIDVAAALQSGQYVTYDADETLGRFMDRASVDPDKFQACFRELVVRYTEGAHILRLYDEMVARLLDAHNLTAALEVEQQWNNLLQDAPFSLYCAYPEKLVEGTDHDTQRSRAIYGLHRSHLCY
jgi:hypothetical protein